MICNLAYSDLVRVYPTVDNNVSIIGEFSGSWFIQALCKILSDPDKTNYLELREILDATAEELAKKRPNQPIKLTDGSESDKIALSLEYTVTAMSKKFYFRHRNQ